MMVDVTAYFGFTCKGSSDDGRERQITTAISPTYVKQILELQEAGATEEDLHEAFPRSWTPGDWDLEVPEEVAPGGQQVHEAVLGGVQAGRDRARRFLGQDGHRRRRERGISSERGRYRRAKADRGEGESGELTSAEREELKRLRKEVREQQQTIGILKKRRPSS
ncbi:hypothetical protein [Kitasatospora cinereorecta]|uniref:hypothetical protein n=1 Tax=Streptomyces sp. NPDC057418 TaxID=3346126 RepID=UPI0033865F0A